MRKKQILYNMHTKFHVLPLFYHSHCQIIQPWVINKLHIRGLVHQIEAKISILLPV